MLLRYRPGPIARSSLQTLAVYGLRLAVQLALLFLVARYLGPAGYGEFAAVAALAFGLGTLSAFGLGFLVLGESAKSPERGQALLAQALPATLLSAIVLGPLYFWLSRSVLGSEASATVLGLIGLSELLLVPWLGLLSQRLHGLGEVARSQALALLPMALRLAGMVACVTLAPGAGLDLYAFVHAAGAIAGLALALGLDGRRAGAFARPAPPTPATLRQGAGYAVMNFMAVNPSELDKALALRLLGAADTGLYALASRGMAVVTLPVIAMLQAALPRLIRDGEQNSNSARKLVWVVMSVAGSYGLFAAILLMFIAPQFLDFIFGEEFEGIDKVMSLVAFIAPAISLRSSGGIILFAFGRPTTRSVIDAMVLAIFMASAIMLTPNYGLFGLVMSVFLGEIIGSSITVFFIFKSLKNADRKMIFTE